MRPGLRGSKTPTPTITGGAYRSPAPEASQEWKRRKAGRHRWTLAGAFVSLLLAFPCFADPATDLLTTGKKAFADGLFTLASKSFRQIIEEFPESSRSEEAAYMLGVSLFYSGQWAEALDTFSGFRSRHPGSLLSLRIAYWLGACSLKLGKHEKALEYLAEQGASGEGAPYRQHAMLLSAAALEALGRDGEAALRLRKLLAEKPPGMIAAEATYRLASAEYRAGRFETSRDLFARVIVEYPQSSFVRDSAFFLAESEFALGNLAEAEKRYRTTLTLYPDSPHGESAAFRLAEISARKAKTADALSLLDQLQRQYPDGAYRGSAALLRADILFDQKRYEDSLAAYDQAVATLRDGVEQQSARYSMGLAQILLGRKTDALVSFEAARTGAAHDVGEKASFQRAFLLAGLGRDSEAIEAFRDTLAEFPASASGEEALRLLATMLEKRGQPAAALEQWDSLVKRYPRSRSFPEHMYRRGSALQKVNRATESLDDFQRIVKEFPGSEWRDESMYSIGYIYSQRGEFSRALPYFQAVAKSAPGREIADRSAFSIGICLFNMGSFEKALASFEALYRIHPQGVGEATIALSMGRTLYRMERLQEASQRLREACGLFEKNPAGGGAEAAEALYWLGWSLFRLNRLVEARDVFLAMAEKHPADSRGAEAYFRAGICETLRGDDAAAVEHFDKALASSSAAFVQMREQTLYERGWALSRGGKREESSATFERLAQEYPGGKLAAEAFFKVAAQDLEAKRYAEAFTGFKRVVHDFPLSLLAGQALYWSAETALESSDARGAVDGFWLSIEAGSLGGLLPSALEGFGKALRSVGDIELARGFAQKARASKDLPNEASASVQLTFAEMLLGSSPSEALAVLLEVKRRAPPEPVAGEASLLLGRYYAAISDWARALDIFTALAGSRADEIGAEAKREQARALEASGRTAEAIEEYVRISYLFPDFSDIAAEGLFDAVRVALKRGERDKAGKIAGSLRRAYPGSPWTLKLSELR